MTLKALKLVSSQDKSSDSKLIVVVVVSIVFAFNLPLLVDFSQVITSLVTYERLLLSHMTALLIAFIITSSALLLANYMLRLHLIIMAPSTLMLLYILRLRGIASNNKAKSPQLKNVTVMFSFYLHHKFTGNSFIANLQSYALMPPNKITAQFSYRNVFTRAANLSLCMLSIDFINIAEKAK